MIRLSEQEGALPVLARKDGETAATTEPRCLKPDCDGSLRDTGRNYGYGLAGAGQVTDLQCTACSAHSWWHKTAAYELVEQDLTL